MAKSYQSFRKRERENRVREKAQRKRERRLLSQQEKARSDAALPAAPTEPAPVSPDVLETKE